MEVEKQKRCPNGHIAVAGITVTLLIILASTTVYSVMKCSQLENRLEKLEIFIEDRLRESISGADLSIPVESEGHIRTRRDVTDRLSDLSLHELLSLRGRDGRDGAKGEDGRDGRDGSDGRDGVNGRDGRDGVDGKDGADGNDGVDGQDGADGRDGQNCNCSAILGSSTAVPAVRSTSTEQYNTLASQLSQVKNALNEHLAQLHTSGGSSNVSVIQGGSSYTRWGRTSCGNNSQSIYQGFVAGSHYTQEGGSAEYTCLPLDPEFNKWTTTDTSGWMYGAEYQSNSFGIFPNEAHDKNVPCARCYTPNRSETIMIPAKRTCPDTWTKEYEGYLMSGAPGHKHPYNYACVDENPEYLAGTHANTDGALFYFIQAHCPSTLHCPPYIESAELSCVVCSK